jgi:hypothetical protein
MSLDAGEPCFASQQWKVSTMKYRIALAPNICKRDLSISPVRRRSRRLRVKSAMPKSKQSESVDGLNKALHGSHHLFRQ